MLFFAVVLLMIVMMMIIFQNRPSNDTKLGDFKLQIHKYSGLNPDLYYEFVNDLELMNSIIDIDTDMASEYLYSSIDKANKLALYSTGVNTYIIDEIKQITDELAVYCEKLILDVALYKGNHFRPIYLNRKIN